MIKYILKKGLAAIGLYHPSLGIKIHSPEKAEILLAHKAPSMRIFVETGTFKGDMIERLAPHFEKVYSIELDQELFTRARVCFAGNPKIMLLQGNSAAELKNVLAELSEPALFWLDAHAPGVITLFGPHAAPTGKEIEAIFAHPIRGHIIFIDDARQFDRASIARLRRLAKENNYRLSVEQGLFIIKS